MNNNSNGKEINGMSQLDDAAKSTKDNGFGRSKGKKYKYPKNGKGRGKRQFQGKANRGVKFNDVSFYTKNKLITDAFTKLPFSYIIGGKLGNLGTLKFGLASIISYVVDWVPTPDTVGLEGTDEFEWNKQQSILDQVKTIVYTHMRRANSGSTNNIEPIDVLTSNLVASIDILCNCVYIAKVFKVANSFSWQNRQIPATIFEHMGINYEDFISHQANYRGRFDTLVAYAKTIRTLTGFPFINAALAEYSNIFKDDESETGREQLIVPIKAFHHIYDPIGTDEHPGGCVRLMEMTDVPKHLSVTEHQLVKTMGHPISGTAGQWTDMYNFDYLLDILDAQIRALVNDADFNLIQADIEKAFGDQSGYFEAAPIDASGEPIKPIFSGEFNSMLENGLFLKFPGNYDNDAGSWVIQRGEYNNFLGQRQVQATGGGMRSEFASITNVSYYAGSVDTHIRNYILTENGVSNAAITGLVNMDVENPNPEDIIIATRYKPRLVEATEEVVPTDWKNQKWPSASLYVTSGSSNFICFGGIITTLEYTSNNGPARQENRTWNNMQWVLEDIAEMSDLQHKPRYFSLVNGTMHCMDDMNNIRFLSGQEMSDINEACFLSLWNLPEKTNI